MISSHFPFLPSTDTQEITIYYDIYITPTNLVLQR